MSSASEYDPTRLSDCAPTFTGADDIKTVYSDWTTTSIDPVASAADDAAYTEATNKCVMLAGYFQSKAFSTTASDYTGFGGLTIAAPTKVTVKQNGNNFYDVYTYDITDSSSNKLIAIQVVDNFDLEAYVEHGASYNHSLRGFDFMHSNSTEYTPPTDNTVIIGSGKESIPAFFLLAGLGTAKVSGALINMADVFTVDKFPYTGGNFIKLTQYTVTNWGYKYPTDVITSAGAKTLYPFAYDNSQYFDTPVVITYDDPVSTCINDLGGSGGLFGVAKHLHGNTPPPPTDPCAIACGITLPVSVTIPSTGNAGDPAIRRSYLDAFYAVHMQLPDHNITDFKARSYNETDRIGAIAAGDDIFIAVWDQFGDEPQVSEADQATTKSISYTMDTTVNYNIITSCDVTYDIHTLEEDLKTNLAGIAGNICIYSFGHHIHSLMRDLGAAGGDPGKIRIFVQGLPTVTTGFTGFGLENQVVFIENMWQDDIVNTKTTYDGVIDDINVNVLYDVSTAAIEDHPECLHTPYAYDALNK